MNEAPTRKSARLQASSKDELFAKRRQTSKSEAVKGPRRKKPKVSKNDGDQQTTPHENKGIHGMPLEMLFEIFSRLSPMDLINLTRTSKDLRTLLRSRSSLSIWKAARANVVPPLPDCPNDLSEPQYAELVFGKSCHYCQCQGIIHTVWEARRRICLGCIDVHCTPLFPNKRMAPISILRQYLPRVEYRGIYFFREFAPLWRKSYDKLTRSKEKEAWKVSKVKERRAIERHAVHCRTWVEKAIQYRRSLEARLRTKRQNDIAKYVARLGWAEEVEKMQASDTKFQDLPEVERKCHTKLTDSVLSGFDAQINEYMSSLKQNRLKRERRAYLKDRLTILQTTLDDHLLAYPTAARYWYPMASELFLHEPKIQAIIDDTSSTIESMTEQLVLILPKIYPDAINQLTRRIDDQLLELIAVAYKTEQDIDRKTIFGLATTVFECADCSKGKRILRYDEAVLHSCTRTFDFPEEYEDREHIVEFLVGKYRSHKKGGLVVSKTALKLVPILIKLCGLDPATTTAQMMDNLNPIFECIPCGNSQGRPAMTWLGAVVHFNGQNHASDTEDFMKLERLNEDEEDVVRKRIIENQERSWASLGGYNPLIQCAHCLKNAVDCSLAELKQHMEPEHGIKKPTSKDLILNIDADHIPPLFYMWPPREIDESEE